MLLFNQIFLRRDDPFQDFEPMLNYLITFSPLPSQRLHRILIRLLKSLELQSFF